MIFTKEIHTGIVQTTLDYCDRQGLEFREFIGSRLSGDYPEGCAQEWVDKVMSFAPSDRRVNGQWMRDVREFLQFYYDQSENMVVTRPEGGDGDELVRCRRAAVEGGWTDEGWNQAANDIYGYKFIRSRNVDELLARFNDQEPLPAQSKELVPSNRSEFVPEHGVALDEVDCEESSSGNGLLCMSLRGFIQRYGGELEGYYDEDFGAGEMSDDVGGDSMILCLVDNGEDHLPEEIKKKIRKAGKFRRDKLKHQWSYVNPLNRIHGYANLVRVKQKNNFIPDEKKVMSISVVCASHFSKKKGIGSDLMKLSEEFARLSRYTDIILEVANEYAGYAEESDEEESDEEESDEEESDEEESDEGWFPGESIIDILTDEFWKKCVRKDKKGRVSYNLEKEYIESCLCSYMYYDSEQYMDKEKVPTPTSETGEFEYGGFWYKKGKQSMIRLMNFYEKMGYKEDPVVHLDWNCFSEIPYPSMRLSLVD
jgi:hypothetical protein